jgi:hypothetical protein
MREQPTLSVQAAPTPSPSYPTGGEHRRAHPHRALPIAAGGALSASALAGCGLLWPLLAPIFEHGGGRASFGCVVVSPPAFMSEEDAADIVREELELAGFTSVQTGADCATFPVTKLRHRDSCSELTDWEVLEGLVVTDRFDVCDREAGFTLEIVSREDWDRVLEEAPFHACSVWGLSLRELADHVAIQAVAGARSRYVAVLYDPVAYDQSYWWDTGDTGLSAEEAGARDLRAQVQDFVAWLQEHGV